MKKLVMIMILAATVSVNSVYAQKMKVVVSDKTGWHKIGETTVNFDKETEVVEILGADRFAKLQFKVTEAPIHILSIMVYYESGDFQTIEINLPIKAPGESKYIDLNGGERNVKKIEFVYKTLPNRKDSKSRVEIWGLKTNTDKK